MAHLFPQLADSAGNTAPCVDMIILQHGGVGEVKAVVFSAAYGDGIFLQGPESGQGLAGIRDRGFGALRQSHSLGGCGGDSGHVLQKVQSSSLPFQKLPGVSGKFRDQVALFNRVSVGLIGFGGKGRI